MDTVKIKGQLTLTLLDASGNVKSCSNIDNLVVTTGKNLIASRIAGNTDSVVTHMALGTGSVAPLIANTTLGAEIVGSRTALSVSGGTPTNNIVICAAEFGPGVGTGAITESGLFNASSGGSMMSRTTFDPVNKDVSDTLNISWSLNII
jgi:hypothetical protein